MSATGSIQALDFISTSDERLKTNITALSEPLKRVEAIRGVDFKWLKNGNADSGVIAQDVQMVFPAAVLETGGFLSVNYGKLTALLIEAVKVMSKRIEALESK